MSQRRPATAQRARAVLSSFKGLISVNDMRLPTLTQTLSRSAHIQARMKSLRERVAYHEVRLVLPPANCANREIFEQVERSSIEALKGSLIELQAELDRVTGQQVLSFT